MMDRRGIDSTLPAHRGRCPLPALLLLGIATLPTGASGGAAGAAGHGGTGYANAGAAGSKGADGPAATAGGAGKILVEYITSCSGSTSPASNVKKL